MNHTFDLHKISRYFGCGKTCLTWTTGLLFTSCLSLLSCTNNDSAPDVSKIPVSIRIERFDRFIFEKWDTTDLAGGIRELQTAFPSFSNDFVVNILGLPGFRGGASDSASMVTFQETKRFIRLTRPLYDSLSLRFSNMQGVEEELGRAFKHVKYYFPGYTVPKVVGYLGPFDAPGIAITPDALAIGLQLYAGRNFSFYTSSQGLELYPAYISRRFEPPYIPVNAMQAVTGDLFPDRSQGRPLIEQMIERGKQWYLLDKLLPATADSLKTGYTQQQLSWCEANEGLIWNFLLQGNDIYTTEPVFIKTFLGEAPTTEGMPAASPGNIGQWIGWQIVRKYQAENPQLKPDAIMNTEAKVIFTGSKYKPR